MDETQKLAFKTTVMPLIRRQEFVIDIDEQIACLEEIIDDIEAERERQLEEMDVEEQ